MRAFEWGAGRSTVWLANHGVQVTAVETRQEWAKFVRDNAPSAHVIICDYNHEDYPDFIDAGAPYDLISVDGYHREKCLPKALLSIAPGGIIAVDNADDAVVLSVIKGWDGILEASFDNGVDRTSFYRG